MDTENYILAQVRSLESSLFSPNRLPFSSSARSQEYFVV
jgi:hypothetical protein